MDSITFLAKFKIKSESDFKSIFLLSITYSNPDRPVDCELSWIISPISSSKSIASSLSLNIPSFIFLVKFSLNAPICNWNIAKIIFLISLFVLLSNISGFLYNFNKEEK